MSAIVTFSAGAKLPAYLQNRAALASINADVISGGLGFPVLSIKGKVFTLVKDGERKVLTRADDPDEVLQSINLAVVRANTKNRVFYAKAYVEGSEGEAAKPDCYSSDGVTPAADARSPQAKKCALCPHSVWESKRNPDGSAAKGTACTVNTRLSVVDPDHVLGVEKIEPYLLRVPAGSRANFADVVKTAEARGIPYNALALKVGFDKEAPSPKLTFKLVGLLDDAAYAAVSGIYEDETVKEMLGLGPVRAAAPTQTTSEATATEADLEAALAAKAARDAAAAQSEKVVTKAAETSKAAVDMSDLDAALGTAEPAEKPARRTATKVKDVQEVEVKQETKVAAPAAESKPASESIAKASAAEVDDLLGGLEALLASTDD